MKFTLSWLREHLDTEASLDTITTTLSAIGIEVEGVEDRGARGETASPCSGDAARQRFGRTVIVTGALVVTAPPLSVARAVSTWVPWLTFRQVKEYGAVVFVASRLPPSRNST